MPKEFKEQDLTPYLRVLVKLAQTSIALAQERNLLALESLSELRDVNKKLCEIEQEQDTQTELLQEIAAADSTPPPAVPGPLKRMVLIFSSAMQ